MKFSGIAILAKDGEVVIEIARGSVDAKGNGKPNRDTQFRIASMTKSFTAVAVMRLVDAGKIGLDDSLRKYLPRHGIP
jgi:CubicO group peptidase (beta-lactamase class C family)